MQKVRNAYPKLISDECPSPSEQSSKSFYKSIDPKVGEWGHLYNHEKRYLKI